MSQDGESPAPDELIDALCLCLSDIETVAYSASRTMRAADPAGIAASGIDEARPQGLGDHVQELRSWVIGHRNPFLGTGIDSTLLLTKLNILHATARRIIEPPRSYPLASYLAESAEIIGLIHEQRSVTNIIFFLEMLGKALGHPSDAMIEIAPEPPHATQPESRPRPEKIHVFVASSRAAQRAAEELALGLPLTSLPLDVTQSWQRLPDLGRQAMAGVRQAIKQCQYGVLVLTPEETTVPHDARDVAGPDTLHLRLSADAEFMLGLMTGALGVEHTFIVVPEDRKDQADLTSLLAGITLATYNPHQVGTESGNAMDMTCTQIARTISKREGNT